MSYSRYLKMPSEEIDHGVVRLGNPYFLHVEKKGKFAKAVTTVVTSVPEGVRPVDLCGQPQIPNVLLTDFDQFIVWCKDEGLLPLGSNGGFSVRLIAKKLDKLVFGGQRVKKFVSFLIHELIHVFEYVRMDYLKRKAIDVNCLGGEMLEHGVFFNEDMRRVNEAVGMPFVLPTYSFD